MTIRVSAEGGDPVDLAAHGGHISPTNVLRVAPLLMGLGTLFVVLAAAGRLRRPTRRDWPMLFAVGVLQMALFMPGYLLNSQGDRMMMGNSVEGRFPFLDHRVVDQPIPRAHIVAVGVNADGRPGNPGRGRFFHRACGMTDK